MAKNICTTFASRIKKYREAKQWSQADLARRMGVNRSYISHLESGTRNPSLTMIAKIAKILGTTAEKLLK